MLVVRFEEKVHGVRGKGCGEGRVCRERGRQPGEGRGTERKTEKKGKERRRGMRGWRRWNGVAREKRRRALASFGANQGSERGRQVTIAKRVWMGGEGQDSKARLEIGKLECWSPELRETWSCVGLFRPPQFRIPHSPGHTPHDLAIPTTTSERTVRCSDGKQGN